MSRFPTPSANSSLADRLIAVREKLYQGGEDILSKIDPYLSSLPKQDASFFSPSIRRTEAGALYYPFAASLTHSLSDLEQAVLTLCALLEESEAAMASEVLLKGGKLLEDYWTYKQAINEFLGSCESLFHTQCDALSLTELHAIPLRLRYKTDEFLTDIRAN